MLTITGPMRSGTSIVARIAHQLGIDMGTTMRLPRAGSGLDPEYEDQPLAEFLAYRALGRQELYGYPTFKDYVVHRQRRTHGKPWGFKSPLIALYWEEWKRVLVKEDEPIQLVLCTRSGSECLSSLTRAARNEHEIQSLLGIQRRIYESLPEIEAEHCILIPFDTPPRDIAQRLATLMGITEYDEAMAIRGIRT